MSTHPGMLLAYDANGDVVATLDHVVQRDDQGKPLGLVDFLAHEDEFGENTAIWSVTGATGSKAWPEWLGAAAHEFRVELTGPAGRKRLSALVHRSSGHRRERAGVEQAIQARIAQAGDRPADIRDLVGGPDRPLALDDTGRTRPRVPVTRPALPLVAAKGKRDATER